MAELVIFTGANSSMAFYSVEHILQKYPTYTVVLTVRDASNQDANTKRLRQIIAKYPEAKALILPLDLASLTATHAFADAIIDGISSGKYPPIAAVVANAFYWNLVGDPEPSEDGYDKTFQVSFLSHAVLVMRLLGSFGAAGGRIVLISSDSHWPGKNAMEKYPPAIPEDMNLLVKPGMVDEDKQGRGYQRYATSKLALTAWGHALNRHLEKDAILKNITVIVMNPGNMVDSRALHTKTPSSLHKMQKFIYKPLFPILRLVMGPTLRTTTVAGPDVIELTLSPEYSGQRGFYTLLQKDESSPDSQNEAIQARLWIQTLQWGGISRSNTALKNAFEIL